MMLPRDKDFQEFGEERDMPADLQEKTPGVYVRADNELPHELDLLWSNTRSYQREERSPLLTFLAGGVAGALLTAAVFMIFILHPQVHTGGTELLAPASDNGAAATQQEATVSQPSTEASGSQATTVASSGSQTYTVESGDTLGHIAGKFYGSTDPQYVDKIQRANNMSSPDSLQLGQKLIIPPKNY